MRCPSCGAYARNRAVVCDACGANLPAPAPGTWASLPDLVPPAPPGDGYAAGDDDYGADTYDPSLDRGRGRPVPFGPPPARSGPTPRAFEQAWPEPSGPRWGQPASPPPFPSTLAPGRNGRAGPHPGAAPSRAPLTPRAPVRAPLTPRVPVRAPLTPRTRGDDARMAHSEKRALGSKRSGWLTGRIPSLRRRGTGPGGAGGRAGFGDAWPDSAPPTRGGSPRSESLGSALGAAWPEAPGGAGVPRMDTGRGYSIVMPTVGVSPPPSFLGNQMPLTPRRGTAFLAAAGGLSRFTFNAILLVIILAIIAIPTGIGLMRLHILPTQGPVVAVPTAKAGAVSTPYPGYQTLRGTAYTIAYPVHWTRATTTLDLKFTGYSGSLPLTTLSKSDTAVAVTSTPVLSGNLLQGMLDGVANAYASGNANFQQLSPPARPRVGGTSWIAEAFSFDKVEASKSVTIQAEVLIANHGLYTYVIVQQAPQSQFAAINSQYFARILSSFHFLATK